MHLITLSGLMLHSRCAAPQKAGPEVKPEYEHHPSPATPTTSNNSTHRRSRLQWLQWLQWSQEVKGLQSLSWLQLQWLR